MDDIIAITNMVDNTTTTITTKTKKNKKTKSNIDTNIEQQLLATKDASKDTNKATLDEILGPNIDNTINVNTKKTNENLSYVNYIDHVLNNGIVKFDNKNQTSMFFVCYKAINIFCNDLKTKYNCAIPQEFIDKQIIDSIPVIIKEYTGNLKKRCKKVVSNEVICLGRKLDNKQCTRKKHNGSEFCKSHLVKLSNGRIDQPITVAIRNKRGRKRKVEFDPRQYDNEYITLWEDIINGEKVLLDGNNNIYTFDLKNPQYIGKKTIDTKLDLPKILKDIKTKNENENETQKPEVIPEASPEKVVIQEVSPEASPEVLIPEKIELSTNIDNNTNNDNKSKSKVKKIQTSTKK